MFTLPTFPTEAKPHEISILMLYALGEKNPQVIAKILHYATSKPVYKALKIHRDFLAQCHIVSPQRHFVGNGLVVSV